MKEAIERMLGNRAQPTGDVPRALQLSLMHGWRERADAGRAALAFADVGFDVFSSTWEDGILLYVFALIGMTNRKCVDIGAGGVDGSNVCNLLVHHGFSGLLIDGDAESLEVARRFYAGRRETKLFPPSIRAGFVTAENVSSICKERGFGGEIDLLCLDIDGVDYWIWKALTEVEPRVVVVEYQDILGPERSWTVPYRRDFEVASYPVNRERRNYCGASLRAFERLATSKGYRLVGCNRGGWNAFFVKEGLADALLPMVTVESCLSSDWNRFGMETRFPLVADLEWQEV